MANKLKADSTCKLKASDTVCRNIIAISQAGNQASKTNITATCGVAKIIYENIAAPSDDKAVVIKPLFGPCTSVISTIAAALIHAAGGTIRPKMAIDAATNAA